MIPGDLPPARLNLAINQAWTNMWPAFGWLLVFTLLTMFATNVWALGQFVLEGPLGILVQSVGFALAFILAGPCIAGLMRAHYVASEGEKVRLADFGYGFQSSFNFAHSIILSLILLLVLATSFLLLILPAFFVGAKLQFAFPRFVQSKCTATQAIQESWNGSQGFYGGSLGLLLLAMLFLILGTAALGVGILVALVLIPQISTVYWRTMDA